MNSINSIPTDVVDSQPSNYSIYQRIALLILLGLCCVLFINIWLLGADHAHTWRQNQAEQLGRSLAKQAALVLAPELEQGKPERLHFHLQNLAMDPHVISAEAYNQRGQLLAGTAPELSLLTNFRLRQDLPLVFVQEMQLNNQLNGYVRLLLDESAVMQYHQQYLQQLYEQTLALMLLSLAAGIVMTRAWYKLQLKRQARKSTPLADA